MADARKVGKNPRTKSDSTTLLSKQQARQLVKTTAALQSGSHLAKALSKIDPTTKACRSGTAWYQQYEEPGQTYTEYTMAAPKVMHPHRLQPTRRNIYLQPIDPCTQSSGATAGMSPDLNVLAQLLATYIPGIQVTILKPWLLRAPSSSKTKAELIVPGGCYDLRCRRAKEGHWQYALTDIADALMYKLPEDACCKMAVSMLDHYEDDDDDFCMGRAWGASRIGCLGFQRYWTPIPVGTVKGSVKAGQAGPRSKRSKRIKTPPAGDAGDSTQLVNVLTYRCCKTVVHEVLHCFLLDHCVAGECLMNTTGNLEEDFRAPLRLCLEDLKKLVYVAGTDVVTRYEQLEQLYKRLPCFGEDAKQVGILLRAARQDHAGATES